ncbi:DUF1611 domain-containing protein [Brevibacterium samyangense]|uniref:DUF1611 domain-containing protein n=1 Tax=Brevibacterium samyangense TaxID=366888 RepID=A0ABN2T5I7_9MICO
MPSTSSLPILSTEPTTHLEALTPQRLRRAKFAYTTRYAQNYAFNTLATGDELFLLSGDTVRPAAGDVVLARIVEIGKQEKVEGPQSRRATLFEGDEVVLAYGNRYAADQYHAVVPDSLEECHMVAAGGVAGRVIEQNAMVDDATRIQPNGILATAYGKLSTQDVARHRLDLADHSTTGRPTVIAAFGTSMNSGKTTTAAHLVHGLAAAGHTVGAAKVTGTGAGNDPGYFADAGAAEVRDFTDFGFPTTFKLDYDHVKALLTNTVRELTASGCSVIVVEIADGLFQGETRRLVEDPVFAGTVDRVVFSASDSLGAVAGVDFLTSRGIEVSGVSGLLTASPLLEAEARVAVDVPVVNTIDLACPEVALSVSFVEAPAGAPGERA